MRPRFLRHFCRLALAAGFLVVAFPEVAEAVRGRPRIEDLTLVAEDGRLLRGSRWSLDILGTIPPAWQYDTLKNTGMNALHVYAESFAEARCRGLSAGHRAALLDQMVDTSASKGIYLVITIGNGSSLNGNGDPNCNTANGSFDGDFAEAFWNFYAPRYKDRTHVIYEIQNEPYYDGVNSHPSPANVRNFEQSMYDLIRSKAPQTPILLYSYAVFNIGSEIVSDLQALSGIDWTKAAVAFHGYGGLSGTTSALSYVTNRSYPVMQTEFLVLQNKVQKPDIEQTDLYERTRTSWLTFVDLPLMGNANNFKNPIDQASLLWAADYGTWPATSAPPFGSTVTLQGRDASLIWEFVTAPSTSTPLVLSFSAPGNKARYQAIQQTGTFWVAIKSVNTNRFVSAPNGGASALIANRTTAGPSEHFDWLETPSGEIFLKARANNRFVKVSSQNQLVANSTRAVAQAAYQTFPEGPCVASDTVMCLRRDRFRVELDWTDFSGNRGQGHVAPFGTDESGVLWFFGPSNLEFLVKVLNGCGVNSRIWVYASAATNVAYTLTVTDTAVREQRVYTNPLGNLAPAITDANAFAGCHLPAGADPGSFGTPFNWTPSVGCTPSPTTHCFRSGRFKVELSWRDYSNRTGSGMVVPYGTDESGLFWFFSQNNWEMLIKVLNGCGVNSRYWVYAAATTDVEYDLTVTDTSTGQKKTYHNALGNAADAIADTNAFATCP